MRAVLLLLGLASLVVAWTNDSAVLYPECVAVPPCADAAFSGRPPELALFAALAVRTGNVFLTQPAWWPNATLTDQAVYASWAILAQRVCSADQFPVLGPSSTFSCVCRPGIECAHPQSTHAATIIWALMLLVAVLVFVLFVKKPLPPTKV